MKGIEDMISKALSGVLTKLSEKYAGAGQEMFGNIAAQVRARFDAIEEKQDLLLTLIGELNHKLDKLLDGQGKSEPDLIECQQRDGTCYAINCPAKDGHCHLPTSNYSSLGGPDIEEKLDNAA